MDALRASTAFSPGGSNHHRRDDRADQADRTDWSSDEIARSVAAWSGAAGQD
jgi:hypothetical protein